MILNLPRYKSHKNVVGALPIASIDRHGQAKIRFLFETAPPRVEVISFPEDIPMPDVRVGDYLIQLEDGTIQWSAPEPFERDYTALTEEPPFKEFDELRTELKHSDEIDQGKHQATEVIQKKEGAKPIVGGKGFTDTMLDSAQAEPFPETPSSKRKDFAEAVKEISVEPHTSKKGTHK